MSITRRKFVVLGGILAMTLLPLVSRAAETPAQPHIAGDWWTVATNPDLGELASGNQQVVDFGIWQAGDGTWQVWSCIRNTKEVGRTRVFYRWEGAHLTDANWTPKGIAFRADPAFGEVPGGPQAPYVFRDGKRFVMFYGSWNDICSADSADGKTFQRRLNAAGKSTLFGGEDGNTRDPLVIRIGDVWHCYYTANFDDHGKDYCRTSHDLRQWSEAHVVAEGGQAGTDRVSAECPFVVQIAPGEFYLFRTQHYGQNAQTSVYFSHDPLDFGVNNDKDHFVCTLPIAAPELFKVNDQWYIAALRPDLQGIQISRLTWK